MGGFNAMASYDVTDWMTVRGWGQYTFYDHNERNNPHMLMNPFYNHTNVGGAFEFKVNDSGFRVGVGVNYEYNPIRGKNASSCSIRQARSECSGSVTEHKEIIDKIIATPTFKCVKTIEP